MKEALKESTLDDYFRSFSTLLGNLNDTNVVIGGMWALKIHGLNILREINDLDIVVYRPTPEQSVIIDTLKAIQGSRRGQPYHNQRSVKVERDGFVLDILIEDKHTPDNLLLYQYNDWYFKVQNIKEVIDAKRSYSYQDETRGGYIREKDVRDIFDLKQANFNL